MFNMNRFATIVISFFLFFGSIAIFSTIGTCEEVNGTTLYVGGSGPGNYSYIQDAINDSSDGDTVFVYSGTYNENIIINKTINLIGENKTNTIIKGTFNNGSEFNYPFIIEVTVDDINIINFTIKDDDVCIFIADSNNNSIKNNIFINSKLGGIVLFNSSFNVIENNDFNNSSLTIRIDSSKNIVRNNIVNEKSLIYFEDESDIIVQNAGQIILLNCNNITIQNQNISNTYDGISLFNSSNCLISNNYISNNEYGISLYESSSIKILNNDLYYNNEAIDLDYSNKNILAFNNISNSYGNAITLYYSSNNQFLNNSISNSGFSGVYVGKESGKNLIIGNTISYNIIFGIELGVQNCINNDNLIFHNNFISNFYQEISGKITNAYSTCGNSWFNSSLKQGNYWDDYTGLDKNNDGIGDEPYVISGEDNVDEYPLMMPYDGAIRLKEFYVDEEQLYTMLIVGLIAAILFCLPVGYIWYRKRYKKK